MLKVIRKFRRSVLGLVGVGLVALAMSGFGVDFMAPKRDSAYALKIGDDEISYDEFNTIRRNIDARYRQMFGPNYQDLLKSLRINVSQQAIDSAIRSSLLKQTAEKLGFFASPQGVQQIIQKELFPDGFNAAQYTAFLSQAGMSPQQFEQGVAQDVLQQQVMAIFTDALQVSKSQAKEVLQREKSKVSAVTLTLKPDDFKTKVANPTDEAIDKYYAEHLTDFQIPEKIQYQYTKLDPSAFASLVPVSEEDIALEYAEHTSRYMTREERVFQQIVQFVAPDAKEEQRENVRKTVAGISEELKKGTAFEDLAKTRSQDLTSAIQGGLAGSFSKDKLPKAIGEKLFSMKVGDVSEPVEAEKGFYILKLVDIKEPRQKELAEVKGEIEDRIRKTQLPAFLLMHGQELLEKLQKSGKSLADFAGEEKLPAPKDSGPMDKQSDPEGLKGVTAQVLDARGDKYQLVESGDAQVLIEVGKFVEEGIQALQEVKPVIIERLKNDQATALAKQKAQEILESIKSNSAASLQEAAKKNDVKTEEHLDATTADAKGVLADPEVRDETFNAAGPQKPGRVFSTPQGFVLVEVTRVSPPAAEEIEKGLDESVKGASRELADFALESFLSKLKAETNIDVQPSLLAE